MKKALPNKIEIYPYQEILKGRIDIIKKKYPEMDGIINSKNYIKFEVAILQNYRQRLEVLILEHSELFSQAFPLLLTIAAALGHIGILKFLMRTPVAQQFKWNQEKQYSPQHSAAQFGEIDILEYFVAQNSSFSAINISFDEIDLSGFAPLHYAIIGGHADVVEYLTLNAHVNLSTITHNQNFIQFSARYLQVKNSSSLTEVRIRIHHFLTSMLPLFNQIQDDDQKGQEPDDLGVDDKFDDTYAIAESLELEMDLEVDFDYEDESRDQDYFRSIEMPREEKATDKVPKRLAINYKPPELYEAVQSQDGQALLYALEKLKPHQPTNPIFIATFSYRDVQGNNVFMLATKLKLLFALRLLYTSKVKMLNQERENDDLFLQAVNNEGKNVFNIAVETKNYELIQFWYQKYEFYKIETLQKEDDKRQTPYDAEKESFSEAVYIDLMEASRTCSFKNLPNNKKSTETIEKITEDDKDANDGNDRFNWIPYLIKQNEEGLNLYEQCLASVDVKKKQKMKMLKFWWKRYRQCGLLALIEHLPPPSSKKNKEAHQAQEIEANEIKATNLSLSESAMNCIKKFNTEPRPPKPKDLEAIAYATDQIVEILTPALARLNGVKSKFGKLKHKVIKEKNKELSRIILTNIKASLVKSDENELIAWLCAVYEYCESSKIGWVQSNNIFTTFKLDILQIFTIKAALHNILHNNKERKILKIPTGDGKTGYFNIFAAFFAFSGFKVRYEAPSPDLLSQTITAGQPFFQLLQLDIAIADSQDITVNQRIVSNKKQMPLITMGTTDQFIALHQRQEVFGTDVFYEEDDEITPKIVLIDEWDDQYDLGAHNGVRTTAPVFTENEILSLVYTYLKEHLVNLDLSDFRNYLSAITATAILRADEVEVWFNAMGRVNIKYQERCTLSDLLKEHQLILDEKIVDTIWIFLLKNAEFDFAKFHSCLRRKYADDVLSNSEIRNWYIAAKMMEYKIYGRHYITVGRTDQRANPPMPYRDIVLVHYEKTGKSQPKLRHGFHLQALLCKKENCPLPSRTSLLAATSHAEHFRDHYANWAVIGATGTLANDKGMDEINQFYDVRCYTYPSRFSSVHERVTINPINIVPNRHRQIAQAVNKVVADYNAGYSTMLIAEDIKEANFYGELFRTLLVDKNKLVLYTDEEFSRTDSPKEAKEAVTQKLKAIKTLAEHPPFILSTTNIGARGLSIILKNMIPAIVVVESWEDFYRLYNKFSEQFTENYILFVYCKDFKQWQIIKIMGSLEPKDKISEFDIKRKSRLEKELAKLTLDNIGKYNPYRLLQIMQEDPDSVQEYRAPEMNILQTSLAYSSLAESNRLGRIRGKGTVTSVFNRKKSHFSRVLEDNSILEGHEQLRVLLDAVDDRNKAQLDTPGFKASQVRYFFYKIISYFPNHLRKQFLNPWAEEVFTPIDQNITQELRRTGSSEIMMEYALSLLNHFWEKYIVPLNIPQMRSPLVFVQFVHKERKTSNLQWAVRIIEQLSKDPSSSYQLPKTPAVPQARTSKPETTFPLLHAAQTGNLGQVKDFLQTQLKSNSGLLINQKDADGKTALHHAAANGDEKLVTTLLHYRARLSRCAQGKTPFHEACERGHLNVVRIFLDYKRKNTHLRINFNRVCKQGKTALHYAVQNLHVEIIKFLPTTGEIFNVTAKDHMGETLLSIAIGYFFGKRKPPANYTGKEKINSDVYDLLFSLFFYINKDLPYALQHYISAPGFERLINLIQIILHNKQISTTKLPNLVSFFVMILEKPAYRKTNIEEIVSFGSWDEICSKLKKLLSRIDQELILGMFEKSRYKPSRPIIDINSFPIRKTVRPVWNLNVEMLIQEIKSLFVLWEDRLDKSVIVAWNDHARLIESILIYQKIKPYNSILSLAAEIKKQIYFLLDHFWKTHLAQIEFCMGAGTTILHLVVMNHSLVLTFIIAETEPPLVNAVNACGQTPKIIAGAIEHSNTLLYNAEIGSEASVALSSLEAFDILNPQGIVESKLDKVLDQIKTICHETTRFTDLDYYQEAYPEFSTYFTEEVLQTLIPTGYKINSEAAKEELIRDLTLYLFEYFSYFHEHWINYKNNTFIALWLNSEKCSSIIEYVFKTQIAIHVDLLSQCQTAGMFYHAQYYLENSPELLKIKNEFEEQYGRVSFDKAHATFIDTTAGLQGVLKSIVGAMANYIESTNENKATLESGINSSLENFNIVLKQDHARSLIAATGTFYKACKGIVDSMEVFFKTSEIQIRSHTEAFYKKLKEAKSTQERTEVISILQFVIPDLAQAINKQAQAMFRQPSAGAHPKQGSAAAQHVLSNPFLQQRRPLSERGLFPLGNGEEKSFMLNQASHLPFSQPRGNSLFSRAPAITTALRGQMGGRGSATASRAALAAEDLFGEDANDDLASYLPYSQSGGNALFSQASAMASALRGQAGGRGSTTTSRAALAPEDLFYDDANDDDVTP